MILHAYVDIYVLCVCIVGHGGDYTTLPFDIDHNEVPLQLQMELTDLQSPEDRKSKFLASHILDFF